MKFIYNTFIIFLTVVFLYNIFNEKPSNNNFYVANKDLPLFSLDKIEGQNFDIKSIKKNKVTIIKLYASWCPYCVKEMPLLNKIKDMGIAPIYGVAVSDNNEKLSKMFEKYGNPFTQNGIDKNKSVMKKFNAMGLPVAYIVDENMKIRYTLLGVMSEDDLNNKIIPAINKIKNEEKI